MEIYGYIYRLKSKKTGKCYIGQTTQEPYTYIKKNYMWNKGGSRRKLKNHILNYGFNDLKIDVIDRAYTKKELCNLEDYYMELWNSIKEGLNCKNSSGHLFKHTQETKDKIRDVLNNLHPNNGRKLSNEHKNKISKANKGRKLSSIHKKRLSEARLNKGKIVKIKNIETNEIIEGPLVLLSRKYNFHYGAMNKYGYTKSFRRVYE